IEDPRPRERYINESKRLFGVLNGHMEGRDWVAGDFSVADIAIVPWLRALDFYGAGEVTEWDSFKNLHAYRARFEDRPAVQKGLTIPARD
ncbi:MAG: glutathione binding-like protein, partial [Pseudomonadota bacterium]